MSKKMFGDAWICISQPNETIAGTNRTANETIKGLVSSRASSTNDHAIVYAPIVKGLIAMLSGRVSAAFTNGNNSTENPVIYVEAENENGELCAILYDSDTNKYKCEWQSSLHEEVIGGRTMPMSEFPIIPRLVELLYNELPEFMEYYEKIREDFFNKPRIECPELVRLCDLLYRHSLLDDEEGFDIDLENDIVFVDTIGLEPNLQGKPIEITEDISHCMGHPGNFNKIIYGNNSSVSSKTIGDTKGYHLCKKEDIPEEYRKEAYFPKMSKNIVMRPEMVEVAEYVFATKDDEQPINNITLYGPTGSGKSFMAKYWASEKCFGVPYLTIGGSGNKDESIFVGMHQNGEKGKTIYVNSKFADYIQMPCVIEMIESNAFDEDVMLILNAFKDHDYGYLITDNFQMIKRHPQCIIVDTFNPGYAGTKTPNRSVLRRSDLMYEIDKVSSEEIKSMIAAIAGIEDERILNLTYNIFETIENYIFTNDLDGEVSMAEYGMCARILALDKKLNRWNPIHTIENTVVNKLVSTLDFDKEIKEDIKSVLKPVISIW